MKKYVIYFAENKNYLDSGEFAFEYSVEATNDDEARKKAKEHFIKHNPSLNINSYTIGFVKC